MAERNIPPLTHKCELFVFAIASNSTILTPFLDVDTLWLEQ